MQKSLIMHSFVRPQPLRLIISSRHYVVRYRLRDAHTARLTNSWTIDWGLTPRRWPTPPTSNFRSTARASTGWEGLLDPGRPRGHQPRFARGRRTTGFPVCSSASRGTCTARLHTGPSPSTHRPCFPCSSMSRVHQFPKNFPISVKGSYCCHPNRLGSCPQNIMSRRAGNHLDVSVVRSHTDVQLPVIRAETLLITGETI